MSNQITTYSSAISNYHDPFSLFSLLPTDLIKRIFSFLSLKGLLQMGATCKTEKNLSEDPAYWTSFYNRIGLFSKREATKFAVIEKMKALIEQTREANPYCAMQAHMKLSKFGLSSLDQAFESAKSITLTEAEKNATCQTFYDKCYDLALAYLTHPNLTKVEDIMQRMAPGIMRGLVVYELIKCYLKKGDLQKAVSIFTSIKQDQPERSYALQALIEAPQVNASEILALIDLNIT